MASGIPAFEMVFNFNSTRPPLASTRFWFGSSNLPNQHEHRIIKFVDPALLQRNNRIVRDMNLLGAGFGAALVDVAHTDAELILEHSKARLRVKRMHLERRHADEKTWSRELLHLLVLAENVAHILA